MGAPRTLSAALSSSDAAEWRDAMDEHLALLDARRAWEWVPASDIPDSETVRTSRWAFAHECNSAGEVIGYMAHVEVAGGDGGARGSEDEDEGTQGEGSEVGDGTYTDVPLSVFRSLRVLLAIAGAESQKLCHIRLPNAHLRHELAEPIYLSPPPNATTERRGAYRLLRPIPGMQMTKTVAAAQIRETLEDMGFGALSCDTAVFVRNAAAEHPTVMLVHGPDLLLMAPTLLEVNDVLIDLQFSHGADNVENLGYPTHLFGLKVDYHHPSRQVWISEVGRLPDLWTRFPELDSLPGQYAPPAEDAYASLTRERYVSLVTYLEHVAQTTRPDTALWVSALKEAAGAPTHHDRASALTLLAHLCKTRNYALAFGGRHDQAPAYSASEPMAVYTHAAALVPRVWQYGYVVHLLGSSVAWDSRRCTFATELRHAEIMGQCEALRQAEAIAALLRELGYERFASNTLPVRAGRTDAGPENEELKQLSLEPTPNGTTPTPAPTSSKRKDPDQVAAAMLYIYRRHRVVFLSPEPYRMGSTTPNLQYAEYLARLVDKASDVDTAQFNYWTMQLGVVEVKPEGCNLKRILDALKGMQII